MTEPVPEPGGSTPFGSERDPTRVVAFSDGVLVAAILFNVLWWHARRDRRLLTATIDSAGIRAIARRFQLALAWIATGSVLGAVVPALGVAVIAAFIPFYWLPIQGEIARMKRRRNRSGRK